LAVYESCSSQSYSISLSALPLSIGYFRFLLNVGWNVVWIVWIVGVLLAMMCASCSFLAMYWVALGCFESALVLKLSKLCLNFVLFVGTIGLLGTLAPRLAVIVVIGWILLS